MTLSQIWELLKTLVKQAESALPGATGKEKKAWCVEKAVALVEQYDQLLPLIGQWADLPVVDSAQRYLIGLAVERAWTELELTA